MMLRPRCAIGVLVLLMALSDPVSSQPAVATVSTPELRIAAEGMGRPVIGRVSHAARLADGSLVIGDDAERTLHWFDAAGRFRFTRGREGSGPGEFRSVTWMSTCGGDSLHVYDRMQDRVAIYAPDGRYVRQRRTTGAASIEACAPDGTLVGIAFTSAAPPGGLQRGTLVALRASERLDTVQAALLIAQSAPLGVRLRVTAGADASGRAIAVFGVGDSAQATVQPLNTPSAPRRVAAGVHGRAPTTAQYAAAVEYWATMIPGTAAEHEVVRGFMRRIPKVTQLPAYAALWVDPVTRALWVQRSHAGDRETVLEQRTLDGALQALVRIPADVTVFEVRDGRLVGRMADAASGEETVVVYRVEPAR